MSDPDALPSCELMIDVPVRENVIFDGEPLRLLMLFPLTNVMLPAVGDTTLPSPSVRVETRAELEIAWKLGSLKLHSMLKRIRRC